jgi:serine/threonine protein phosphatase PrpC
MEDEVVVVENVEKELANCNERISFFAVYDGHGGVR